MARTFKRDEIEQITKIAKEVAVKILMEAKTVKKADKKVKD